MTRSQQELFDYVKASPRMVSEVARHFACSIGTASVRLNRLRDLGFLTARTRSGAYVYEVKS